VDIAGDGGLLEVGPDLEAAGVVAKMRRRWGA